MDEVLKLKIKTFGYIRGKDILKDIDLTINRGEIIVLTGPSGCGKTSLIRIMNGLIPNHYDGYLDGKVEILSRSFDEYLPGELAKHIGNVFQSPSDQFFGNIAEDEVALAGENLGMPYDELREKVDRAFKRLDIEKLKDKKLSELSGGEKQKVAIASTLVYDTDLIFFDEPSASLDNKGIEEFKRLLLSLKSMGKTIIIGEHRLFFLKDIYDRLIYIDGGTIKNTFALGELREEDCRKYGLRTLDYDKLELENPILSNKVSQKVRKLDVKIGNRLLIKDLSFDLYEGEVLGILGNNGKGKSTLGRILGGLGGNRQEISFGRKEGDRLKKSYYMMQDVDYQLFFDTVENELIPKNKQTDPDYLDTIRRVLKDLDLWDKRMDHPQCLSGGEKQRLALANSFLSQRDVIILDEPTSGLDYGRMEKVKDIIEKYSNKRPVLIITHDVELLFKVCNTALLIDDGAYRKIKIDGNKTRILNFLKRDLKDI